MNSLLNQDSNQIEYLLLGASGLLGREIAKLIDVSDHVLKPNRIQLNRLAKKPFFKRQEVQNCDSKMIIINCLANTAQGKISRKVNFEIPKQILKNLGSSTIIWVQVSSYFQMYKLQYGVDKDEYSKNKTEFSDYLERECSKFKFRYLDVTIPHLLSPHERDDRLMKRMVRSLQADKVFHLSSGNQVVPTIDIRDSANELTLAINDFLLTDVKSSQIFVTPTIIIPLRELALSYGQHVGKSKLLKFGMLADRNNEFYGITWPENSVMRVNPRKSLSETFDWYISQV